MNLSRQGTDDLGKANTRFAFELYEALRTQPGSLFFSPYSLSCALALTTSGARESTQEQMEQALHWQGLMNHLHTDFKTLQASLLQAGTQQGIRLLLANSLWHQQDYPFQPEFMQLAQEFYQAEARPVDYAGDPAGAAQAINAWVDAQTEHMISDLVSADSFNALTRLTLVNAIYFKGRWEHPFDPAATREAPFWITPTESLPVPMMEQTAMLRYAAIDEAQMVELPYVGGRLALAALLPEQAERLEQLEKRLADWPRRWQERLAPRRVHVVLPRLRLNSAFQLDEPLKRLGMPEAFEAGKANFSGMDGKTNWLYISAVLHRAVLQVNEEGSEAAAATGVVVTARAMPEPALELRLDRPFLLLIWDRETQTILFIGRVSRPQ